MNMNPATHSADTVVRQSGPLRVLLATLKWDYGNKERGHSYEHELMHGTLAGMPNVELHHFPYDKILHEHGRKEMNRRLLEAVDKVAPDLCFFVLYSDEFEPETIRRITKSGNTLTYNWFCDDHFRFDSFTRYYAPLFSRVSTTDYLALPKYRHIGCDTVFLTQWAFNPFLNAPPSNGYTHDVTFVGAAHTYRRALVEKLRSAGIDIQCWGRGWENGRLSLKEMLTTFVTSKINLNLSESVEAHGWVKPLGKAMLHRRCDNSYHLNSPRQMAAHLRLLFRRPAPQLKGRLFEIPGAGGFELTAHAPAIEQYYTPDSDLVVFHSVDELVEKIRYYLSHDGERERIRRNGHERTLREHTYVHRFNEVFRALGVGD